MSIRENLGRLGHGNHFFVYRLSEWNGKKWKRKQPWSMRYNNNIKPDMAYNWMSYDAALAAVAAAPVEPGVEWCVGMWITEGMGIFFVDIDGLPTEYTLTPEASAIISRFPGCMVEWSSSRCGVHIIGSRTADIEHANEAPGGLELYTDGRGVALATSAQGTIDTEATEQLHALAGEHFPPRARGPVGIIIPPVPGARRDLAAVSLVMRQGDKIKAAPEGQRNATLNTAAFVVGGMVGAGRISRDEARASLTSAVEAAGWGDLDTQIAKIDQAIESGMHEPIVRTAPVVTTSSPTVGVVADTAIEDIDWTVIVENAISMIANSGTHKELMNSIVPAIQEMHIDSNYSERVVKALGKRLDMFDAKPSVAKLRQMVNPSSKAQLADLAPPDWFAPFCYVRRTESYYNTITGTEFSADNFRTEFTRYMPTKPNGMSKEDPVQWARERWNVVTVDDTMYRPDCGVYFEWGERQYVNEYLPSALPALSSPTPNATICIKAFEAHLMLMCGHRPALYNELLCWIAHNAQFPGRKIRWSPIIKGVPGDGKSIVSDLMRAVLGMSNVKMTSISNLSNSGGFTDWAHGAAVNFIEEIQLTGKERYKLFNSIKTYIADNFIDINRKGRPAGDTIYNVTNHWANTNYGDALPIDDGDRRWCVVFTPYDSIAEAASAKGLPNTDSLVNHFKMLGASMRSEPGAWRAWLLSVDTSSFNPDGRAPETDEKHSMKLMSQDALDQAVVDVLEVGGYGIAKEVFCSKNVMGSVELKIGEKPATRSWNTLLARLGYQQHGKMVWWSGTSQRVWTKRAMTSEQIKEILDATIK